jgi:hypothetical protein
VLIGFLFAPDRAMDFICRRTKYNGPNIPSLYSNELESRYEIFGSLGRDAKIHEAACTCTCE